MGWVDADSLWQRRSSLPLKKPKWGHHSEVELLIARLLPSDARFIQTAVGWVLWISRQYAQLAGRLFEIHLTIIHEVIVGIDIFESSELKQQAAHAELYSGQVESNRGFISLPQDAVCFLSFSLGS